MRVDLMARMRGVDPFPKLWRRRTTIELPDGAECQLLALPDLVLVKKTQRDKDWPMIRRLMEAHYFSRREAPTPGRVRFWLREMRTPELLVEIARAHPSACRRLSKERALLVETELEKLPDLERALQAEESAEREEDRRYWLPLRAELENLRLSRRKAPQI